MLKEKIFDILINNGCITESEKSDMKALQEQFSFDLNDTKDFYTSYNISLKKLKQDYKLLKRYQKQVKKFVKKKLKDNGIR